jgi:Zn-dependent M16 (insulinase) family peptidase
VVSPLYSPEDGVFSFASYRDPHIRATLEAFRGSRAFVNSGSFGREDVKEAILQVCSEIDKPDPPGSAARKAFYRRLIGLSREQRVAFKERLLAVDTEMIARVARRWFPPDAGERNVAVIAGEVALGKANGKMEAPLTLYSI